MISTSVAVRQTLAYTARYGTSASSSMSVYMPAFAGIKLFCLLTSKRVQRNLLLSRAMAGDQTQALLVACLTSYHCATILPIGTHHINNSKTNYTKGHNHGDFLWVNVASMQMQPNTGITSFSNPKVVRIIIKNDQKQKWYKQNELLFSYKVSSVVQCACCNNKLFARWCKAQDKVKVEGIMWLLFATLRCRHADDN